MTMIDDRRRALLFAGALGSALAVAELARPRRTDTVRAGVPLESMFPPSFGRWRLDEQTHGLVRPADERGRQYEVYDQVLERAYLDEFGSRVMLSAAYGSEQSPALQVHRPEVCYAAAGFNITGTRNERMVLDLRSIPVTRLHARLPGRSEPITYWMVLGDRVATDAASFRWQQFTSGFAGSVRDGMLVRISSIDPDRNASYSLHARFANDLMKAMQPEHRDRVFGRDAA